MRGDRTVKGRIGRIVSAPTPHWVGRPWPRAGSPDIPVISFDDLEASGGAAVVVQT